jgi:hypothetical protein
MRSVLAFSLGAVVCLLAGGNASATTLDELLRSCEAVVNAAGATAGDTIDIPPAGLRCWYYMSAIQNMSVVVDQGGERLLDVCAPPDTTLMDYVRIFVRYAHRNLKGLQGNAAAFAITRLSEAFPCDRKRAP